MAVSNRQRLDRQENRKPLAGGLQLRRRAKAKRQKRKTTQSDITRHKQVERKVQETGEQLSFETLLAELSAKLINLPAGEIDRQIEETQRLVCEALGLDLSSLWQWRPDNPRMLRLTHLYRPLGGPAVPEPMDAQDFFPWSQRKMLAGRVVALSSMADFPAEATRDRQVSEHYGIKSSLTFPLAAGGGPVLGCVSFNDMKSERHWSGALVKRLELVAQMFANALARKVTDQALRESEARLSLAADAAGVGLWSLDLSTDRFWFTDKTRELFEFAADEEVTFGRFLSLVHAEDRSNVRETVRTMVQSRREGQLQYRAVRADGEVRWMLSRGRLYCDDSGKPERVMGVTVDITDRKLGEDKLRQAFEVVEKGPALVVITDAKGKISYVNRKFSEVTGYTRAEVVGKNPRILKSGEFSPAGYRELWATITQGKTWSGEFHNRKKNGELFWESAVISPLMDEEGKTTHFVAIKEDITERKRVETALRESVERFRQVAELAGEFIWEVDAKGLYTYASPSIEKILGYTPAELVGKKHFYDLFEPSVREELKVAAFRVFADRKTFRDFPNANISKRGKLVHLETSGVPIVDATGKLTGYRGADTDVTARRQAEAEAQHSRLELAHMSRVSTLGELAASLAHELSQPLGAILRNAETAELMLKTATPDLEELLAIIVDIGNDDKRATDVIDRLRSLLKRRSLALEPIEINTLVSEVLLLVQADAAVRHVKLKHVGVRDLSRVHGDRVHLQQVLLNLLLNAMDALGGIAARNRNIEITTQRAGADGIEVRVCDNGPGISSESLERLFEPFYTTKPNGMGMGLPVSKTIIEAHQGRIWAEDGPEGGACFCFTLPMAKGEARSS